MDDKTYEKFVRWAAIIIVALLLVFIGLALMALILLLGELIFESV